MTGFWRDIRGNVAMMYGLLLFPVLMGVGMGLDYYRADRARNILQESADAGLLAAVRSKMLTPNMPLADMTAVARRYFDANGAGNVDAAITNFEVTFDPVNDTYQLVFNASINTTILGAVGIGSIDSDEGSQVQMGKPPYLEVVMALDNTGSMNSNGKLSTLKKSAQNLVDSLFMVPGAEVQIGLVPFAQYVSLGTSYNTASWLSVPVAFSGCVGSRDYPGNVQDSNYSASPIPGITGAPCPDPLLPLTNNTTKIEDAIKAMDANGWTYIPAGLVWAWRLLTPEEPFTEGIAFSDLKDREGYKAIVLMTDGENTRSPDYPTHNFSNTLTANELTEEICQGVKDDDIIIYTIAFQVSDVTIKNLLQDCATSAGHYYAAEASKDLEDAFASIANSLRSISLSR